MCRGSVSAFAFALLLSRGVSSSAAPVALRAPGTRSFLFSYEAHLTALPPSARETHLWMPLATTRDGQEVLSRTVRSNVPYSVEQEAEFGNELLHVRLTAPWPERVDIAVEYRVTVRGRRVTADQPSPAVAVESLQRDLSPEALIVIDDRIRAMARAATAGRTTDEARARGIYDYVIRFMRYDKTVPGWGRGNSRRACALAAGNCTDFHSLFIALARAAGIPARFKIGVTVPSSGAGTIPGYHCWAEFFTRELGWAPVDASEAWKDPANRAYYFGTVDANKLLLSVGRDLRLQPAQQGAPVNMLVMPYVEVDGQPFDRVDAQFRFRTLHTQQEDT